MKKQISRNFPGFLSITIVIYFIVVAGCSKAKVVLENLKKVTLQAKIVYTDISPDSVILNTSPSTFNLDLNNDGISDFFFNATKTTCGDGLLAPLVPYIYLSVGGSVMTKSADSANLLDLVSVLDSATVIGPDSLWLTNSRYLLYGASEGGYIRCMVVHGYWLNVSDQYLGLKFINGDNTYYGWARFSSTYSVTPAPYLHLTSGLLILKDYAYNSVPGQPILAGQTK